MRVFVAVRVGVGVLVGVRVFVGVRVIVGVLLGVSLGVSVIVGVLVGVAVHTRNGQTVGVQVRVGVQVGGMVGVRDGVKVIVGVIGFMIRLTRLAEPRMMMRISRPNPPKIAYLTAGGSCARPPRRRGAVLAGAGLPGADEAAAFTAAAASTGAAAASTRGVSVAGCLAANAATWADKSLRRFSLSFCNSLVALALLGLIARTWRRQSSFSASSTATVLSHSQAFSLRGSVTSARLNSSRAFSLWPRLAAMMPWPMRSFASISQSQP